MGPILNPQFIHNNNDISQVRINYNYLYNNLKTLGEKEKLNINQGFISRLKYRINSWYLDSDFIFLSLCVTEDHLEKILIKNVYYAKMLIMELNM